MALPRAYLSTFIYDTDLVKDLKVNSKEFSNFLVTLTQTIGDIISTINSKEYAIYVLEEVLTNKLLFTPNADVLAGRPQLIRNGYRIVVDFGALPNAATKSVPHNIENIDQFFRFIIIDGAASDPVALTYIKLPFSSPTLNENIKVTVDATNVNITTAIDYTSYTTVYIILEYVKF